MRLVDLVALPLRLVRSGIFPVPGFCVSVRLVLHFETRVLLRCCLITGAEHRPGMINESSPPVPHPKQLQVGAGTHSKPCNVVF